MATVLYIDDEAPIRRAVRSWLTRKGHVVHEAEDAASARAVLEAHSDHLDGVFIDVRLGEESGVELFAWLVDRVPRLATRVAWVTGDHSEMPAPTEAYDHPVFGKPFELPALEAQAARWGADSG